MTHVPCIIDSENFKRYGRFTLREEEDGDFELTIAIARSGICR
ncbi:hypothetical protein OK016_24960 [Vibrio chagasii]|nr:hypothetical protein [Vibrio chagasii]